jgi:hypothetical protein
VLDNKNMTSKISNLICLFLFSSLVNAQTLTHESLFRGAAIILEEVNFFTDQYKLVHAQYDELDFLAKAMEELPKLTIEIISYTDIIGNANENQALSEKRALEIKRYLVEKGINEKRINAVGRGSAKPLIAESNPINQRIEISVISNPHFKKSKGYDDGLRNPNLNTTGQKRMALVIGNTAYENSPSLRNPVNDAMLMASTLSSLEFEVVTLTNLSFKQMINSLKHFSTQVNKADVVLFYFAGHGLQINGTNYLLPTDVKFENGESDVPFESINLELVLKIMEYTNQKCLNMIILDACRNNPFKSWSRGGDGLGEVKAPSGTLIAYSTSPGSLASDGTGENGLYTSVLVKHLTQSQRVEDIFMQTRIEVEELSKGSQSPWELSKLRGKFYLK